MIEILIIAVIIGAATYFGLSRHYLRNMAKAESVKLIIALNALKSAQDHYYLANNKYAYNIKDLDSSFLWFDTNDEDGSMHIIENPKGWSNYISIYTAEKTNISSCYADGPYKDNGFIYTYYDEEDIPKNVILCIERKSAGKDSFCKDIVSYNNLVFQNSGTNYYKRN